MAEIAVFPGSFDPVTLGHVDIVNRGARLFDKVFIAVGHNTTKNYLLPFETRREILEHIFRDSQNVEVVGYHDLTIQLCRKLEAKYILRGLRSSADFDFERNIAFMNSQMAPEIETVFLLTSPKYAGINSTIVREIIRFGGDVSSFIPEGVVTFLAKDRLR